MTTDVIGPAGVVSFQIFDVDGRYLAARDDEVGYCNYAIETVS